jgi:MFS family permease
MEAAQEIQKRPLLTGQFVLLLFGTIAFGLSFATYFLLPKYLSVEFSADPITIGGISAVAMLSSVIAVPFVGVQIDRHGRKLFGVIGALSFAIASAGFLWVDSVGPLMWILRIIQGAAFSFFYISISTLATDVAPVERLGQAIGIFGSVMVSTNAFGPALAEWVASNFGWSAVFAYTVVAALLAAAIAAFIREKPRDGHLRQTTSMRQVLKRPGIQRILLIAIMVGWSMGALYTFYQPWALSLGYENVSGYLASYAICAMIIRIALGDLADRLGRLRIAKITLFLYIAAPFSMIWLDVFGLYLTGGLLGIAHGLFFPALNAVAIDCALESERGKGMAAYHGSFNIGFAAGSYFLGFVAMATSFPVIFSISGITCAAAFLLLCTVPKQTSR